MLGINLWIHFFALVIFIIFFWHLLGLHNKATFFYRIGRHRQKPEQWRTMGQPLLFLWNFARVLPLQTDHFPDLWAIYFKQPTHVIQPRVFYDLYESCLITQVSWDENEQILTFTLGRPQQIPDAAGALARSLGLENNGVMIRGS